MKTPLTSQSVGRKAIIINPKIMKKINRATNVQNFSQKPQKVVDILKF